MIRQRAVDIERSSIPDEAQRFLVSLGRVPEVDPCDHCTLVELSGSEVAADGGFPRSRTLFL
ncbi:MAG: hypothetical protein KDA89_04305 [Planctomycetaceae bacterium]|nr:hypothetical protein [Planctomycetaceae bacterium]